MQIPARPAEDAARFGALRALHVLDTPTEERFDRITRLATRIFQVPIAVVSLVDEEREWFKSCQGLDAREGSRNSSFCGHTILGAGTLVIPDASQDPRFADNPQVTGPLHIRFYAGHPLNSVEGQCVGALCVKDRVPRGFGPEEVQRLRDLAAWAEHELNYETLRAAHRELVQQRPMLEAKLRELEVLNRIMMGREARILELKQALQAARRSNGAPGEGNDA